MLARSEPLSLIEINDAQIEEARRYLATVPWATGRYTITKGDATRLEFEAESFDSAFLCWVLEHVGSPTRVLSEVRRVLHPLLAENKVSQEIVDGMTRELDVVARDANSVFFYAFIQGRARAW